MSEDIREAWADIRPEHDPEPVPEPGPTVDRLEEAVRCYKARQARREHPEGRFYKQNRFYPSEEERCSCCDGIRQPSARWPYSLMKHCRTVPHIANLFGVDPRDLRRELRPPKNLPGPKDAWERLRKAS
jgi:hypothetical protein